MTAKEELRQVYKLQCHIDRLKRQREDIRNSMYGMSSPAGNLSPDKVQTSIAGDKMTALIADLEDLEVAIVESIRRLTFLKVEIIEKIESMENEDYKTVLFSRYVELKKWELIAVEMNFDIRHVYRLHGNALIAYGNVMRCH